MRHECSSLTSFDSRTASSSQHIRTACTTTTTTTTTTATTATTATTTTIATTATSATSATTTTTTTILRGHHARIHSSAAHLSKAAPNCRPSAFPLPPSGASPSFPSSEAAWRSAVNRSTAIPRSLSQPLIIHTYIHTVVYTCGIFWAIASLGPKYTTSVSNPF